MVIDPKKESYSAVVETSKGTITFDLFADEAPLTVNNFVFLARDGFYNGVIFHRIIKNFMVQTGDPEGSGRGGPGYKFKDEPVKRNYVSGTLAMANAGPNTNGSQFFIVHAKDAGLPKNYTIFGIATEGTNVIDDLASTPVTQSAGGEKSSPIAAPTIKKIEIKSKAKP